MQIGQVGEKVVSDEDGEEDEVVDDTFEGVRKGKDGGYGVELEVKVLAHERKMQEIEINRFQAAWAKSGLWLRRNRVHVPVPASLPGSGTKLDLLPKQAKVGIMAEEAKHDKIGIEAIEAVADVRVIVGLCAGEADVLHDLVLALARDLVPRENDTDGAPVSIFGDLFVDEVVQLAGEACHEGRALV